MNFSSFLANFQFRAELKKVTSRAGPSRKSFSSSYVSSQLGSDSSLEFLHFYNTISYDSVPRHQSSCFAHSRLGGTGTEEPNFISFMFCLVLFSFMYIMFYSFISLLAFISLYWPRLPFISPIAQIGYFWIF